MMGVKLTSRSFRHDINYCLKDKLTQAKESVERQVVCKNRAEIIHFNQCYGTTQELVRQFREVTELNHNICKPYLHVILGLPPQDRLTNSQWVDASMACSRALGFGNHQFVAIRHRDTAHDHVHLLVNRIGFEGGVVEDRYLLQKMNKYCLQAEIDYGLTQTRGMRCFQTAEQRQTPRQNKRLDRLQEAIGNSLKTACDILAFDEEMRRQGYTVYRNEQGIAFHDEMRVILRGSEAGYPWKKIQHELDENVALRLREGEVQQEPERLRLQQEQQPEHTRRQGYRLHL